MMTDDRDDSEYFLERRMLYFYSLVVHCQNFAENVNRV